LVSSTRLVLRRAASHVGVLLTAMLTALVAATLLVSAAVLAPGVAESGFRKTIAEFDPAEFTVQASTALDPATWSDTDADVRRAANREPRLAAAVSAAAWSTAYTVPGADADIRIAVGAVEAPSEQADLVDGHWPEPGADPLQVAVHEGALDALGVEVGDTIVLDPLVGSADPTTAAVVGSFAPADPADPLWRDYSVGVRPASGNLLAVVGPVLFDIDDLVNRVEPGSATALWSVDVGTAGLDLDNARQLAAGSQALADVLSEVRTGGDRSRMSVRGETSVLIERAFTAAASVRAVLLVVVMMLAVLGAWALVFTARLLAERRAPATALLRARGIDPWRLVWWSALGTALPAVVVAVAAPPLSRLVLSPVPLSGAAIASATSITAWVVSAGVATGWLVLMVFADVRAGQSVAGVSADRARPPRRAALQRAGLDVLAVVLALVGLQQLRRPGTLPEVVLVVAPALVVLGGTVVLVRALPWIGRGAAVLIGGRPGAPAMLGSLELARRPLRHAAASALVVLALAVSVFAAASQSTWSAFRSAVVDLTHPADVAVTTDFDTVEPEAIPLRTEQVGQELSALPGVEAVMPVNRTVDVVNDRQVDIVGIDAQNATGIMRWNEPRDTALLTETAEQNIVPAFVTRPYAALLGLSAADSETPQLTFEAAGVQVRANIVGLVDIVPSSSSAYAVLVDRAALADAADVIVVPTTEYWLATSDDGRATAREAAELTFVTGASTHVETSAAAANDPSVAGVLAGLAAGLTFAAVFVFIGVVVHAVTSLRSRTSEQAVLQAVGLGVRGSVGSIAVEQTVLLSYSTAGGIGLGLLVAWLVVPRTIGGLAGLPEVPPLHVAVPGAVLGALVAAIAILVACGVLVSAVTVRRIDVASVLRAGEDT
jgi:hypothetical protein